MARYREEVLLRVGKVADAGSRKVAPPDPVSAHALAELESNFAFSVHGTAPTLPVVVPLMSLVLVV